jgi:hypothetical protein
MVGASVISPMSQRWLVLMATTISVACGNACGGSGLAQHQTADARLYGRVSACLGIPVKCSSAEAMVTILGVRGTTFDKAVSKQYTRHGRFSFLLAPGKYFPAATFVHARLNGGHCIAGERLIRAHQSVDANIYCYAKLRRAASRG